MRKIYAVGVVRGILWQIVGWALGVGILTGIRYLLRLPPWKAESAIVFGALLGALFFVYGTGVIDERMVSTVSSIVTSSGLIGEPKPIVAMTEAEGGKIKVSGRLPDELKGKVNLGLIFREATEKIGGVGGGHDVAAGAEFPKENEAEFVKLVDESVGRMLSTQKTDN